MMNLNEFGKEIHNNAIEHGFWDKPRLTEEVLTLIVSEWIEAFEEYRAGRSNVWYNEDGKPEGICVELIDGVIRVLDYCAADSYPVSFMEPLPVLKDYLSTIDFSTFTYRLIELTMTRCFSACVEYVYAYCEINNIDTDALLIEKHEYNKTRPYKHNKKC